MSEENIDFSQNESQAKPLPVSPDIFSEDLPKKKPSKLRLYIVSIVTVALVSGTGFAYAHYKRVLSASIVKGDGGDNKSTRMLVNQAQQSPDQDLIDALQKPGDGRINILLLGIGGVNDKGIAHPGSNLTDSIQLLSVDAVHSQATLTSVPRDFYYSADGRSGSKINAVYEFANQAKSQSGGEAIKKAVGEVLGVSIQHFVLLDFSGAKELIDIVGGITVAVPKAIYDPTFPDDRAKGYAPFFMPAGERSMDGATALRYMRSRHADNDFGRSARQQQVMLALREKILSGSVLTSPTKVSQILVSLSEHVRTDLQPQEIYQVLNVYKRLDKNALQTSVLDASPEQNLLYSASDPYAGSILLPKKGRRDFSAIQNWFHQKNQDPYLKSEKPTVYITNSGVTENELLEFSEKLKAYGYTVVVQPSSVPTKDATTKYYSKKSGKAVSYRYLLSLLPESSIASSAPIATQQTEDFQISLGADLVKR